MGWVGWSRLTAGSTEVDDVAVLLEHVDLLDTLDGLDVQLLQGGLQLLVVGVGGPVDLLDLAAGSALASVSGNSVLVGIRSEFESIVHGVDGEFEIVGIGRRGVILVCRV